MVVLLLILGIVGGFLLWLPSDKPSEKNQQEEMRGIWFAFNEWNTTLKGNSKAEFEKNVDTILKNIKSLGCNTLFLHVRAFGDAMYPSDYFPWSKSCSGSLGVSPGYDPLEIFAKKAKEQNIALHAWINPLRTMSDSDFALISDEYQIKKWYNSPERYRYFIKDANGRYNMIPANPETRKLVCDGAKELAEKYDIAGIHMDDYFYPSGCDNLAENDLQYYQEVQPQVSIGDWRREATSSLVQELYSAVKEANPNCVFGISPQANMKNNQESMFIDVKQWVSQKGYVDYILPQIYFGFLNQVYPFDKAAKEWNDMVTEESVKLYAGLPAYKIGMDIDPHAGSGQNEWKEVSQGENDILKREIAEVNSLSRYSGYAFYTYASFFLPDGSQNPITAKEVENLKESEKEKTG